MAKKNWLALILVMILLLTMLGGCKTTEENGETAVTDTVVENSETEEAPGKEEMGAPSGNSAESNRNETDSQNGQKEESKDEQKEDPKEETTDKEPADNEPQKDPVEEEQPKGESSTEAEDPYVVPISKTEAKTADGVTYYKENKLKVVSYNIRSANDPNGNSIEERAPRLETVIKKYDPDLIGMQEFTEPWEYPAYFSFSDDYEYEVIYRAKEEREAAPILWKRSKFKLLDSGYYWLSETPEKESKGWDAACYRMVMWVKLEVRQTGSTFYFVNTHFDHVSETARVNSADLLIKRADTICKGQPMILTGDFNADQKSKTYAKLTTKFTDVNLAKDMTGTFNNYGKANSVIDFCFVTAETAKPMHYAVMTDKVGGKYASDHYGVYTEVIIL